MCRDVDLTDREALAGWLTPAQLALFEGMHRADQRHGLDVMASLRGDGHAADTDLLLAGLFHDAAARWDRIGNVVERADALFGAGRCLLALGREGDAAERFAGARTIFGGLGATVMVAAIDSASLPAAEASGSAGA